MAVLLFLLVSAINAFWRMPCHTRSSLARIEALVITGSVSNMSIPSIAHEEPNNMHVEGNAKGSHNACNPYIVPS
jgi:hypothetical protein